MEFRLLGPVEAWAEGVQLPLRRRQERLLLAVLLLDPGKPVSADRLIDLLWPDAPPASPKRALQVYVSRLRSLLATGNVQLTNTPAGYTINGGQTDLADFQGLLFQAKSEQDLTTRSTLLTEALALWRGPALADVAEEAVRDRLCRALDELWWEAKELHLSIELELGHHREVLPDLAQLTGDRPAREKLAHAYMLALYRSGRQAEALAAYESLRSHLDSELGVEPGAEVRQLQAAILKQDESLDLAPGRAVPRELPADVSVLVGRDELLTELADWMLGGRPAGIPAVVCLHGAAGTGKSAAAVRLGHRLAGDFPGGQLFARLQDVAGEEIPARAVLGQLLRSLGVDGSSIPESVEERSALLRSRLARTATLLVLDDAIDAGQVRPLLPAEGRCGVIITSRQPLLGLEDAAHRRLEPLSDEASAELLDALTGRPAETLTDLIAYCAGLPLALRIVGARITLVQEELADVVKALSDDSQRLDYLVAGDRAVRASLDLTIRVAAPEARRLFGLLAIVGTDEFSPWVAPALLGVDEDTAQPVFDHLVALGLVQLRRLDPPRYGMHGLVRSFAAEISERDPVAGRTGVARPYLETVRRLASIADQSVEHGLNPIITLDPVGGFPLPGAEVAAAAGLAWFERELLVLQAAARLAADLSPRLAGMLAIACQGFLAVRDHREVREEVLGTARDAVAAAGEVDLDAELNRMLFGARAQHDAQPGELVLLADRGLAAARRTGFNPSIVGALNQVGWAAATCGDYPRALAVSAEMLELVDPDASSPAVLSRALATQGGALHYLGRVGEAQAVRRRVCDLEPAATRRRSICLVLLAESLLAGPDLGADHTTELRAVIAAARGIVDRLGDRLGSAHVDVVEAQLLVVTGELDRAEELMDRADSIFAEQSDAFGVADNLLGRARLLLARGRPGDARRLLEDAIRRFAPTTSRKPQLTYVLRFGGVILGLMPGPGQNVP